MHLYWSEIEFVYKFEIGFFNFIACKWKIHSVTDVLPGVLRINLTEICHLQTEVHIQRHTTPLGEDYFGLTCAPSCPLTDLRPAYKWYWMKQPYRNSESQNFTVTRYSEVSCAVQGHEDLHSASICEYDWALTPITIQRD